MNIHITDAAQEQLAEMTIEEGYGLRIDAELTGG